MRKCNYRCHLSMYLKSMGSWGGGGGGGGGDWIQEIESLLRNREESDLEAVCFLAQ